MRIEYKFLYLMFLYMPSLVSSEVVCESSGTCVESPSRCQCDSLHNCYSVVVDDHQYASYVPGTRDGLISGGRRTTCEVTTGQTSAKRTDITIESIRLRYVSISPKYLAVCVSWSLSQSSGSSGGLVVQYVNEWDMVTARYCVTNSSTREICINNYQYYTLQGQEYLVQVHPFPLATDDDIEALQKSQRIRSLTGCSDADSNVGTCGPKTYKAPTNVTVLSRICDEGKDLIVSWQPPSGAEPIPHVYYVSMYARRRRWKSFQVINSSQITLKNLGVNVNYSVNVRAYGKCAGLGDYYTSSGSCGTNRLGCGRPTSRITEAWVDSPSTAIYPSTDPSYTSTNKKFIANKNEASTDSDKYEDNSSIYIIIVSVICSILVVIFTILGVSVCIFILRPKQVKKIKNNIICIFKLRLKQVKKIKNNDEKPRNHFTL